MKWLGKAVGGVVGGMIGGPVFGVLGAALGVLIGHQFDAREDGPHEALSDEERATLGERYFRTTFRVMGCLAKADGRVSEREIAAARGVMEELRLAPAQVRQAIDCFGEGKQPQFDLDGNIAALARDCRGRPDLARIFLEIQIRAALGGNDLDGPVRALLGRIAHGLGISSLEFLHIETVLRIRQGSFRPGAGPAGGNGHGTRGAGGASAAAARDRSLEEAYRVLGAEPSASDEEVAKAYRRQLQRHHPDKLKANGLPESMMAHAKQRTQQIIEAWERVRERRGIR